MSENILLIILGWLFGLLGAPIVSRIERRHKRNDLKAAIFSELKYLAVKLAAACQKIQMHLGVRDKSTLFWVKGIYEKYRTDVPKNVLEAMNKVLQAPDEHFNIASSFLKAPDNVDLSLKTFSVPFIESILADLSVFDSEFQSGIFEIRDQISVLNEEIENGTFYFRLSFDPAAMNTNGEAIRKNLNSAYNNIQERCKLIVNKTEKILKNKRNE